MVEARSWKYFSGSSVGSSVAVVPRAFFLKKQKPRRASIDCPIAVDTPDRMRQRRRDGKRPMRERPASDRLTTTTQQRFLSLTSRFLNGFWKVHSVTQRMKWKKKKKTKTGKTKQKTKCVLVPSRTKSAYQHVQYTFQLCIFVFFSFKLRTKTYFLIYKKSF
jgi:hypothetical protein